MGTRKHASTAPFAPRTVHIRDLDPLKYHALRFSTRERTTTLADVTDWLIDDNQIDQCPELTRREAGASSSSADSRRTVASSGIGPGSAVPLPGEAAKKVAVDVFERRKRTVRWSRSRPISAWSPRVAEH